MKTKILPCESKYIAYSQGDGISCFSVESKGMTGRKWLRHFENQKTHVREEMQKELLSDAFLSTCGVKYNVWIFADRNRWGPRVPIRGFLAAAQRRHLVTPSLEVVCLVRDALTDTDLIPHIGGSGMLWAANRRMRSDVVEASCIGRNAGISVLGLHECDAYGTGCHAWMFVQPQK